MFNGWKEKRNERRIERIKMKYPNKDNMFRIYKLASFGDIESIKILEDMNKESQPMREALAKFMHKKRLKELHTGNISIPPTRKELKNLEHMTREEIAVDGYTFDDIGVMVNNIKTYNKNKILFVLTWIGTIITIISAGLTLFGLLYSR